MELQPNDTELVGGWIVEGRRVSGDATCERVEHLIKTHLKQVAISPKWGAWETLFQDPNDNRYWERTYPQGEQHGGDPPRLRCLSADEAKQKYGDAVNVP